MSKPRCSAAPPGSPFDQFTLDSPPIDPHGFQVFTLAAPTWQRWTPEADLVESSARDAPRAVLAGRWDAAVRGRRERTAASGWSAYVFAIGNTTGAAVGNVRAHAVSRLEDSPHNRALLGVRWPDVSSHLALVDNPIAASGGATAETPDQASLRAIDLVDSGNRAVTADDFEQLALATAGVRLARALAIPDFHGNFPCFEAPGIVTVVIVPFLPAGRPTPSRSSRALVASCLNRHRLIGTAIRVVGPEFVTVSLTVRVRALRGVDRVALQARVVAKLTGFLDPLTGSESGAGWPFGRPVFRADLLSVVAGVIGVDHVLSLTLSGGCADASCTEICLPRTGLACPGTLAVEVV